MKRALSRTGFSGLLLASFFEVFVYPITPINAVRGFIKYCVCLNQKT